MSIKLHEREKNVNRATIDLSNFLENLRTTLTEGEYLKVITGELSREWADTAKYIIREERHPGEPDKAGGLE